MNRSVSDVGPHRIVAPDLASPSFKADPYPFYARLRAGPPLWRTTLPGKRAAWLVTRYEDVAAVLKDKEGRFAKDKLNAMGPGQRKRAPWVPGFLKPLERNMLDLDDPDHARLRSLVGKAFTPRLVERLRGRVESLSEGLLDAMERKGAREGRAVVVRRADNRWLPPRRCLERPHKGGRGDSVRHRVGAGGLGAVVAKWHARGASLTSELNFVEFILPRTRVNRALDELEDGLVDRAVPFDS